MPKIKTNRTKPPPEGYEEIEQVLEEYARKMRDGQSILFDRNFDTIPYHQGKLRLLGHKGRSSNGKLFGRSGGSYNGGGGILREPQLARPRHAKSIQPLLVSGVAYIEWSTDRLHNSTAETESHEGKRKTESLWPIMRITHTRSRYIYDLYYKRDAISKELYDWLIKQEYADAKSVPFFPLDSWERRLTSRIAAQSDCKVEEVGIREAVLRTVHSIEGQFIAISPMECETDHSEQDMNYAGSTCICRVPKAHLKDGTVVECTHCGNLSFVRFLEIATDASQLDRLSRLCVD